ncbi:MAG: hypothetical protein GC161_18510 [Planctomycetaceae bacterium]|nr:hypothetical protein [Planctomycetaceae bacterium]
MTCEISSKVDFNPGHLTETTPVDTGETDGANIRAHIRDVNLMPGIMDGTSIRTQWPGLWPDGVVTDREENETTSDWLDRHRSRCLDRLLTNPINCP